MGDLLGSPRVAPLILQKISTLRSTPSKFSAFLFSLSALTPLGCSEATVSREAANRPPPKRPGDYAVFEERKNNPEDVVGVILRSFKSTPVDSIGPFRFRNMVIIVVTITELRDSSVLRLKRFLDIAGPLV